MTLLRPLALLVLVAVAAPRAEARPAYFDVFSGLYGLSSGDDLYACGVCHQRWEGTGARNPYGNAVEQQLYIGKTIAQSILDVEPADTDGDGFTNGDEIAVYGTLPGYSCANWFVAIDPPANLQSLITPLLASCLEPLDIRVVAQETAVIAPVGQTGHLTVTIYNNGSDDPLLVTGIALLAGTGSAFSVDAPATPFAIPVGDQLDLDVAYAPLAVGGEMVTLRITSDDPDEPTIDVALTGLGVTTNLAPAATRAACLADVEQQVEKYAKRSLQEWGRCWVDEVGGRACNVARRDQKIARAELQLRRVLGGDRDDTCAGANLTPTLLGLPTTCPAPCGGVAVTTLTGWADCLVCQQQAAVETLLAAAVGSVPPDPPANTLAGSALGCQKRVVKGLQKNALKLQRLAAGCALENVTAAVPVDCAATLAAETAALRAAADAAFDSCRDTTDMLACRLAPMPDPTCLGTAAQSIADRLVDAVFP